MNMRAKILKKNQKIFSQTSEIPNLENERKIHERTKNPTK